MTVPRPHDRPIGMQAAAGETLKPSRCGYRRPVFGFAVILCYVLATDRSTGEALAVMVSLLAVPVAAAVAPCFRFTPRRHAQQHTRHLVTATITDDTAAQNISRTTATIAARWSTAGPNTPARS
jgi:hypothetical protein